MNDKIDEQLAQFTDDIMNNTETLKLELDSDQNNLEDLQGTVLKMANFVSYAPAEKASGRILATLKTQWDKDKQTQIPVWKSPKQRRNAFAFGLSFASIVIAAILITFLPVGEGTLPAASNGNISTQVFMFLAALILIVSLIFWRNKK